MKRRLKTLKKVGQAPGTHHHIGEKKAEHTRIRVFDYLGDHLKEEHVDSVEACKPYKETETVSWINVDGLHEPQVISQLGELFEIHPLVMEDVLNTNQRPKLEDYEKYIFITLKMFGFDKDKAEITSDQFSLVLGSNYLLTFQERFGQVFEPVRERIRKTKWRIRKLGTDYLAYALIDTIVDHYFVILEHISEKVEKLDEEVMENPTTETLKEIHKLKSGITSLRKSMWPLREVAGNLMRTESKLITKETSFYLRDLYDHTVRVVESLDTLRDMVAGLLEVYLSNASNKMNEIMKVLTIFAAIFIPLTFVAGIYGMNFEFMPELKWHYAYPAVIGTMLVAAGVMLWFFRRKKWL